MDRGEQEHAGGGEERKDDELGPGGADPRLVLHRDEGGQDGADDEEFLEEETEAVPDVEAAPEFGIGGGDAEGGEADEDEADDGGLGQPGDGGAAEGFPEEQAEAENDDEDLGDEELGEVHGESRGRGINELRAVGPRRAGSRRGGGRGRSRGRGASPAGRGRGPGPSRTRDR